ncbi:MAG: DUF4837 family protein [Bacteroidales bacterium]|nr:DUF4837 family protein [Bacteroidales bacterium]
MKKNHFLPNILIILLSLFTIQSCELKVPVLKHSSGKTAEMIVVTNNEAQWNSKIGKTIKDWFAQEHIGLPQPEPAFSVVNIPEPKFKKMFQLHRNIFIVNIDEKIKKTNIETKKDLWAQPQRVIKITAPSEEAFLKAFNKSKESFTLLFDKVERRRIIGTFKSFADISIKNELKDKFGISMIIPGGFYIAQKGKDFIWLRKETHTFGEGILIYSYDYTDTIAYEPKRIIDIRDSITKQFIPGPSDGSYMKVSQDVIYPFFKEINFNNNFAIETRGLWKVEGNFMGGPFLSYTLVNDKSLKVITADAYLYNPKEKKVKYMRQLEAILYSLSFVEE